MSADGPHPQQETEIPEVSDNNDTAQYSECGKCGGRTVMRGRVWYHISAPLHCPRHYAEPPMRAVFSPADFLATAAQLSRHLGLVGEIA